MLTWIYEYATTRELAIAIWTTVLLLGLLFIASTRRGVRKILRSFANWRVWLPLSIYGVYLSLVVLVLWWLRLWDKSFLGGTGMWFLASGLALVVTAVVEAPKEPDFFRRCLIATAGLTVLVEVVVNFSTFDLWVELLLFPTLVALSLAQGAAIRKADTFKLGIVLAFLMLGIVLALATITLLELFQSSPGAWKELIREVFLLLVLGIATIPFAYMLSLLAAYGAMFAAVRSKGTESSLSLRVRFGLVSVLLGNIQLIHDFTKHNKRNAAQVRTLRSARGLVKRHKQDMRTREENGTQAQQRLKDLAGVVGVDDDGKQIDRREFAETKKALEWLHLCMAGHYRNRKYYRSDMLDFLQSFADRGLSDPHGISLQVRGDGQAWFAYRTTPSGYVLGIGANGPEPYRWFYGGLKTPTDFPATESQQWTSELHPEPFKEWEDEPEK